MPKAQTRKENKELSELQLQVLISEYEKLRDEILHAISAINQLLLVALTSASFALPVLVGQSGAIPAPILAALLFTLSIIYSVLIMNFVNTADTVVMLGKYIHEYLAPKVNQLLQTSDAEPVLFWESYSRKERSNFISLFLSGIGPLGSLLLICIPALASLFFAQYILLTSAAAVPPQDLSLQFISSWLTPLSIIAWGFFIVSILASILLYTYNSIKAKWAI